jgi:hypothetical protein
MRKAFVILFFLPLISQAHCPYSIKTKSQNYCLDIQWLNSEIKVKGGWQTSPELSPYLISMGEVPQKWHYSKVQFLVWLEGDNNHKPQKIENLNIKPYMKMADGHHHQASSDFYWNDENQVYELKRLALQEMQGCWQLDWTLEDEQLPIDNFLMNVENYTNLTESENLEMVKFCGAESGSNTHAGHH